MEENIKWGNQEKVEKAETMNRRGMGRPQDRFDTGDTEDRVDTTEGVG